MKWAKEQDWAAWLEVMVVAATIAYEFAKMLKQGRDAKG